MSRGWARLLGIRGLVSQRTLYSPTDGKGEKKAFGADMAQEATHAFRGSIRAPRMIAGINDPPLIFQKLSKCRTGHPDSLGVRNPPKMEELILSGNGIGSGT